MKRRDFIKSSVVLSALGAGIPSLLLAANKRFSFRNSAIDSDRIVLFIKMNGGNDGLNTVIPFQNASYYQERPLVSIPNGQSLPITDTLALHPALESWQSLFNEQKLAIIQGVGYIDGNLSHFRSSDIWDTGSDEDEELTTGWLGRLLELEYPGFPNNAPDHPLAIQFNSANLLEFKTSESNTALYLYDPDTMYSLITGNYVNDQNEEIPDTYGGDELAFIRELDYMSFNYSQVVYEASQNAPNTIMNYPNTNIGEQFKVTARLIAGGLATPFYRLYQHGYDTHVEQLYRHEQLLSELADALNAFLTEMDALSLLDRVLIVTTSEFGRRVIENSSEGTDHGTSAPVLVFGSQANGGVFGVDPDLQNLDENGNLPVQFDYRQVFSTIITDWFGLGQETASNVFGEEFESIPFIQSQLSTKNIILPSKFEVQPAYPNPFNPKTTIHFSIPSKSHVKINIFNILGELIQEYDLGFIKPGDQMFTLNGKSLPSGQLMIQLITDFGVMSQKVTLLK